MAAYYQRNRERIRTLQKAYSDARRQELNAKEMLRRAGFTPEQREAELSYKREWGKANRARHAAKSTAWRRANPDRHNAIVRRRNAAVRHATVRDLTAEQWMHIQEAHDFRCVYCGARPARLTQDHVIPLSKGGGHTAANVVPACLSCNCSKGVREKPSWQIQT